MKIGTDASATQERFGRFMGSIKRRGAAAVVVAASGLMLLTPLASAQQATPIGEAVSPEECTTPARSADFLAQLIATPAATTPGPLISELPAGTEPDAETRDAVIAHLRQLVACSNAGDVLRALTLYSDEYLRRTINPLGQMTEQDALDLVAPFATPIALTEDLYARIVEFPVIRQTADGKVVALLTSIPVGGGDPTTDLFILSKTEDGWIIDDAVMAFTGGDAAAAATPTS